MAHQPTISTFMKNTPTTHIDTTSTPTLDPKQKVSTPAITPEAQHQPPTPTPPHFYSTLTHALPTPTAPTTSPTSDDNTLLPTIPPPSWTTPTLPPPSTPLLTLPDSPTTLSTFLHQTNPDLHTSHTYSFKPLHNTHSLSNPDAPAPAAWDEHARLLPPQLLHTLHQLQPWELDVCADDVCNTFNPLIRHYFHTNNTPYSGYYTTKGHDALTNLPDYLAHYSTFLIHPNYHNNKKDAPEYTTAWVNQLLKTLRDTATPKKGWVILQGADEGSQADRALLLDFRQAVSRLRRFVSKVLSFTNVTFLTPTPNHDDPFHVSYHSHPFSPTIFAFYVDSTNHFNPPDYIRSYDCNSSPKLNTILAELGRRPPPSTATLRLDIHLEDWTQNPTVRDLYLFLHEETHSDTHTISSRNAKWPFEGGRKPYSPNKAYGRFDYTASASTILDLHTALRSSPNFGKTFFCAVLESIPSPHFYIIQPKRDVQQRTMDITKASIPIYDLYHTTNELIQHGGSIDQCILRNAFTLLVHITLPAHGTNTTIYALAESLFHQGYLLLQANTLSLVRFSNNTASPQSHKNRPAYSPPSATISKLTPSQALITTPRSTPLPNIKMAAAVAGRYHDLVYDNQPDPFKMGPQALIVTYDNPDSAILASAIRLDSIQFHTTHSKSTFAQLFHKHQGEKPPNSYADDSFQIAVACIGKRWGSEDALKELEDALEEPASRDAPLWKEGWDDSILYEPLIPTTTTTSTSTGLAPNSNSMPRPSAQSTSSSSHASSSTSTLTISTSSPDLC